MARTKNKKSDLSFDGLGLTKEEDVSLELYLKEKDMSCAQLKRFLVRKWMMEVYNEKKINAMTSGKPAPIKPVWV